MARDEAILAIRTALSLLPHGDGVGEARTAAIGALEQLLGELDQAEELLDEGWEALEQALPVALRPQLDRIVMSRRMKRQ
jgi:hypothetical protein